MIFDLDDTLFPRLPDNYTEENLQNISLYPRVKEILLNQSIIFFLVTKGDPIFQNKKIDNLGVRLYFEDIFVCSEDLDKKVCFQNIISKLPNEDVLVIGDRINSEIKWGNELGLTTVHFKRGKYKDLKPNDNSEIANHQIETYDELLDLLNKLK